MMKQGGRTLSRRPRIFRRRRRSKSVLVCLVVLCCILMARFVLRRLSVRNEYNKTTLQEEEYLLVYQWRNDTLQPRFGEQVVDPSNNNHNNNNNLLLIPHTPTLVSIDQAHRQGLVHTGAWLFLVDTESQILLLQRSSSMVTCPNAWSLPGEHSLGSQETPLETVQRGIQEELGSAIISHVAFYKPITTHPVFYFREYGPSLANRIDRQLTYLWWIQLDTNGNKIRLNIDDEVADYEWVPIETLEQRIRNAKEEEALKNNNGVFEEGPFCDKTIVELFLLSMKHLKEAMQQTRVD